MAVEKTSFGMWRTSAGQLHLDEKFARQMEERDELVRKQKEYTALFHTPLGPGLPSVAEMFEADQARYEAGREERERKERIARDGEVMTELADL